MDALELVVTFAKIDPPPPPPPPPHRGLFSLKERIGPLEIPRKRGYCFPPLGGSLVSGGRPFFFFRLPRFFFSGSSRFFLMHLQLEVVSLPLKSKDLLRSCIFPSFPEVADIRLLCSFPLPSLTFFRNAKNRPSLLLYVSFLRLAHIDFEPGALFPLPRGIVESSFRNDPRGARRPISYVFDSSHERPPFYCRGCFSTTYLFLAGVFGIRPACCITELLKRV